MASSRPDALGTWSLAVGSSGERWMAAAPGQQLRQPKCSQKSSLPLHWIRPALCGLGAAGATLGMQGCTSNCVGNQGVTGLEFDLDALDRRAGCINDFDVWWGNPCASDVPVPWAKKGAEKHADYEYLTTQATQSESYKCKESSASGLFCWTWTKSEVSCDLQEWGECVCLEASGNEQYCKSWQCISKQADQNLCRGACCGDGCEPCVECGVHGSSPFPMDEERFRTLLAEEGVVIGASMQGTIDALRASHYGSYRAYGDCIVSRRLRYLSEMPPCEDWRVIETELKYCWCEVALGDMYCESWACEDRDIGMYSILFYREMEYSPWVDGIERETGVCEATALNRNGGTQCSQWRVETSSYAEVRVAHCLACSSEAGCNEWVCDEYALPRIHHVSSWWRRAALLVLHMLWLLPFMVGNEMFFIVEKDRPDSSWISKAAIGAFSFITTGITICFIYAVGFWRFEAKRLRWRAPVGPWIGLFVVVVPAWLLCSAALVAAPKPWLPLINVTVFFVAGAVWTIGLAPLLVMLGLVLTGFCCCGLLTLRGKVKSAQEVSAALFPGQRKAVAWASHVDDDDVAPAAPVAEVIAAHEPYEAEATKHSNHRADNMPRIFF